MSIKFLAFTTVIALSPSVQYLLNTQVSKMINLLSPSPNGSATPTTYNKYHQLLDRNTTKYSTFFGGSLIFSLTALFFKLIFDALKEIKFETQFLQYYVT